MIPSDGGGSPSSGATTNWYGKGMYEMWSMIGFRDLTPHYEQASSWKKTSELASLHKERLKAFHDRLAQAWPPDNSEASRVYLAKLDDLIKAVENVEKIAGENYKYSVEIPSAIAEAKRKLEPIMKKYQETETAQVNGTPTATPSPSPSGQKPADPQQGRLDEARRIMSTLSGDLVTAQYGLTKPAEYRPPKPVGLDEHTELGPLTPPIIPPVVPVMPTPTPTPMATPRPLTPMPMPVGPDLTGLTPPTPTLPGPVPIGTPPIPVTPPGLPITGVPGPLPPTGVIGGLPPGMTNNLPGVKPVTGVVNGLGPNAVRGAMPPGGVIGGPAAGPRGGTAGLRANPVGGMIGGAAGGKGAPGRGPGVVGAGGVAGRGAGGMLAGGPGARGGVGAHGAPGALGASRGGHHEDGDPDTEWSVDQGVAPVLDAPEAARPVDPGPAIGLSR